MTNRNPMISLLALASACTTTFAGGGGGGGDDLEFPEVVDVDATCDGTASAFDWLFVLEVRTDIPAYDVACEITQGRFSYGTWALNDEGSGTRWYGEVWEDDLGIDCESSATIFLDCFAE